MITAVLYVRITTDGMNVCLTAYTMAISALGSSPLRESIPGPGQAAGQLHPGGFSLSPKAQYPLWCPDEAGSKQVIKWVGSVLAVYGSEAPIVHRRSGEFEASPFGHPTSIDNT
ncbi:hypothetical protein Bca4012_003638 [Brassica carinata]